MKRYGIQTRCLLLSFALLALSGCGGDDPTQPVPSGPEPLVFNNFQEASFVIGQLDMSGDDSNLGGVVGPIGLRSPGSVSNGLPLFVVDAGNNRVLGFNDFPSGNGQAADFVVGQEDLTSSGSGTTAINMKTPTDAVVAAGKLFVADFNNNRILIWNSIPRSNVPADVVVGQLEFTTVPPSDLPEPTARSFKSYRIAVSGGKLFASDDFNHRILIWNSIPTQNGAEADVVVGQTDFTSNVPGLSATSLNRPVGFWVGSSKLVIADARNHRVLIYNTIPTTNGAAADIVIGAPDFVTEGSGIVGPTTFEAPADVTSDGTNLFVADEGNNRVLIFPFPKLNGAEATGVLGQSNFSLSASNDPDQDGEIGPAATGRTFHQPSTLAIFENQLIVTDNRNNRLLVFESN